MEARAGVNRARGVASAREEAFAWLATVWFKVVTAEHVVHRPASDEITFSHLFNKYWLWL